MPNQYTVDRCVCHQTLFESLIPEIERLKQIDQSEESILQSLKDQMICSTGCRLCEPYIRLTISTGQTRFAPLPFSHD